MEYDDFFSYLMFINLYKPRYNDNFTYLAMMKYYYDIIMCTSYDIHVLMQPCFEFIKLFDV